MVFHDESCRPAPLIQSPQEHTAPCREGKGKVPEFLIPEREKLTKRLPTLRPTCSHRGMGTGACSKSTAPSDESSMAAYYARRAQEYERIFQKPERQADLRS